MARKKDLTTVSTDDLTAELSRRQVIKSRPTVAELEALLQHEEEVPIEILPNGEIRALGESERIETPKVLTTRENLGGEYAEAA